MRNAKSTLYLLALLSMGLVWLTVPFWSPPAAEPETSLEKPASDPSSGFRYRDEAPPPRPRADAAAEGGNRASLLRQLKRREQLHQQGIVRGVVDNPGMPEEIRIRFRRELERLDQLAVEHPELALEVQRPDLPRRVNPDGTFTPEFQEVTGMMAHAGVWDQLHDSYIRQLEAAAADPNLPEEEKPTPEDIRRARAERRIPSP